MPNQYKNIDKIAQLNDFLRGYILTATPVKDKIVITEGVSKLDKQIQRKLAISSKSKKVYFLRFLNNEKIETPKTNIQ